MMFTEETTQMPSMGKGLTLWHIHTTEQKPGTTPDTHNNLDQPPGNYAEWKRPFPKVTYRMIPFINILEMRPL